MNSPSQELIDQMREQIRFNIICRGDRIIIQIEDPKIPGTALEVERKDIMEALKAACRIAGI